MITIDTLRKQSFKPPRRSGTGYIKLQCNIDGQYFAYRFYNNIYYPRSLDQIHTHRATFKSTTLHGTLRNIIYTVSPTDEEAQYFLTQGWCMAKEFANHEIREENVEVKVEREFTTSVGEGYTLESDIFHRIEFDTPSVITKIQPLRTKNIPPYYVVDREVGWLDPWCETLPPDKCWEVIDWCLKN